MGDRRPDHLLVGSNRLVPIRTKLQSPKIAAKIAEIKSTLMARGWEEDKHGHLHKRFRSRPEFAEDGIERHYRYKFGKGSLRREIRSGNMWTRLMSAPYGKIMVNDEVKLRGLKR